MATTKRPPLRPLRLIRTSSDRGRDSDLPHVPQPVPARALAPNWRSPTEDNGLSAPRADLHIALIAPDADTAKQLRKVRVVKPPLWQGGKIFLHVITERKGWGMDDYKIMQAVADLGWADARDLQIGPPDAVTNGYPSGSTE